MGYFKFHIPGKVNNQNKAQSDYIKKPDSTYPIGQEYQFTKVYQVSYLIYETHDAN